MTSKSIDPKQYRRICSALDELMTSRISLLTQHPEHDSYHYGMITDICIQKNIIYLVDMTPEAGIEHWEKSHHLKFSSSPQKGINYTFSSKFHALSNKDKKYYSVFFPDSIQVIEMRKFPRIRVGIGSNINISASVENPIDISSETLRSLLSDSCQYDGNLFDISQNGIQIILPGNQTDIFKKAMTITTNIITEKVSMNIQFDVNIRWAYYDSSATITRIGGCFANQSAEQKHTLAHLISSIQSSLYHKFL